MRRKIACITLIVSLIALSNVSSEPPALSLKKQYDMGYFLTVPENGALVVIGVAGRGPNQTE
ncbi:MAG: hypothetical protein LBS97_04825, partial [Treponema sp.]|nr:hypothetical protein [Treponema sp.]